MYKCLRFSAKLKSHQNRLPQEAHLNQIVNFCLYILWNIATHQRINLPLLIFKHHFRCWNRVCLPYVWLLIRLFLKKFKNIGRYCYSRERDRLWFDFQQSCDSKEQEGKSCTNIEESLAGIDDYVDSNMEEVPVQEERQQEEETTKPRAI